MSGASGSVALMTETAAPIRVIVVDDDQMVVTGIRGILDAAPDIDVVGSAHSGEEALEKVALHFPDLVLMDIRMPGIGGIEAMERLTNGVRPPKVVALTSFDTDDYLFRALDAGAVGYILKDIGPTALAEAIRRVHDGESFLSPQATKMMIRKVTANPDQRSQRLAEEQLATLTERELQIAVLVADGLSNQEIAEATFMSPATVKTHLNRINFKLDTNNRVRIAVLVERARVTRPVPPHLGDHPH
ncbi:response regulator transcription factor [Brevibacterium celere]